MKKANPRESRGRKAWSLIPCRGDMIVRLPKDI
jgi:hypothetical protein